jgi:hypothetical protein
MNENFIKSPYEITVINPNSGELGKELGISEEWIENTVKPAVNGPHDNIASILIEASKCARNANELMFLGFMIAVNLGLTK